MEIYKFAFNPYVLLPITAVTLYLILLINLYKYRLASKANQWFFVYLIVSISAGFPSILASISTNVIDGTIWESLFFTIICFSFPIQFGFMLYYTNHTKLIDKKWFRIAMFIPAVCISLLSVFTGNIYSHDLSKVRYEHMMWHIPAGPLFEPMYISQIMFVFIVSIIFFTRRAIKVQDERIRKQSNLFAAALVIQLVVDSLLVLVLPKVFGTPLVPDGLFMTVIMGTMFAWGILKYDLFAINPATVVTNIISTMSEVLIVLNPQGNIEFINKATEEILGYTESDLVGQNVKTLISDDWARFYHSIFQPIIRGVSHANMEGSILKKNGELLPVNLSASAVGQKSGVIDGVVCVATDITHLKELYDVTAQRDKLSAVIESMSDGIIALDNQGKVALANLAALNMTNSPGENVVGLGVEDIFNIKSKDELVTTAQVLDILKTAESEKKVIVHEYTLTLSSGVHRYVGVSFTPIKQKDSWFSAIMAIHDLTEQRQFDAMKVDFVSMAAHELRTPLTAIKGYLQMFDKEYGTTLVPGQKDMLSNVYSSAQRLTDLVDDILGASRIESRDFRLSLQEFDWNDVVNKAVSEFNDRAKERQVSIDYQEVAGLPKVLVDEPRIHEVLSNLLSNAIKYSPQEGEIKVWAELKGSEIVTSVKDEGPGIPAEAISHLFTKFYRVPGKLEQTVRGTGLGLYISKEIVELHKGKIWVDSEVGKGSTFMFSIPVEINNK